MNSKIPEIIEKFNSKEVKNNVVTQIVENDPEYSIIMRDLITTEEVIIYLNNETKMVESEPKKIITSDVYKNIVKKYPLIFANIDLTDETSCKFSVGDGWADTVDIMCRYISRYLREQNYDSEKVEQVRAIRIRRYGPQFNFQYTGGDEHIRAVVEYSEYLSNFVCEKCGTREDVGVVIGMNSRLCKQDWLNWHISNSWEANSNGKWWTKSDDGKIKEWYYDHDNDMKQTYTDVEEVCEFNVYKS